MKTTTSSLLSGALLITEEANKIAKQNALSITEISESLAGIEGKGEIASYRLQDSFPGIKIYQVGYHSSMNGLLVDFSDACLIQPLAGDVLSSVQSGMALLSSTTFHLIELLLDESKSVEIDGTFFRNLNPYDFDFDQYCSSGPDDVVIDLGDMDVIGTVRFTKKEVATATLRDEHTLRVGNFDLSFYDVIQTRFRA